MKLYTTKQAAERAGIMPRRLRALIASGEIAAPSLRKLAGGLSVRLWSERDIKRIIRYRAEHPVGRPARKKKK